METSLVSNQTAATTIAPPTEAENAKTNISADFETFLKMLTVQMQNQDPLNPVDSSDYAVQLATFSGVEQQVQTNDLLRGLAASMGAAGLSEMAGWVGMEARTTAPAHFSGAPVTIVPAPEPGADALQLVVLDEDGTEVQRLDIPNATEPVIWAGVQSNGTPFATGRYTFETASFSLGRPIGQTPAEVYRRVTEVQLVNGANVLIMEGGVQVNATAVTALRDPKLSQ